MEASLMEAFREEILKEKNSNYTIRTAYEQAHKIMECWRMVGIPAEDLLENYVTYMTTGNFLLFMFESQLVPNGSKWVQMGPVESKWVQMGPNESKWVQMGHN